MIFKKIERKVDFLVCGAQKAGTSAMQSYLRAHPEVGMGRSKELHFFDDEENFKNGRPNYRKYLRKFDFSTNMKVYGECTPIYIYWEPCAGRIWEYNREIKLVFVLRDPSSRAFSHWNMEFGRNLEQKGFSEAIRTERERVREALPFQHRFYSYIDRGYYSQQIRRFRRFFPDAQLCFLKYEEFKQSQEKVLNELFEFLRVAPFEYKHERHVVNRREKQGQLDPEDRKFMIDLFRNDIHQVEKELGWDCSDWLEA